MPVWPFSIRLHSASCVSCQSQAVRFTISDSYPFPVLVVDVAFCQSKTNYALLLVGQFVVPIHQIHVALARLVPVAEDHGRDTTPSHCQSDSSSYERNVRANVPVPVLPRCIFSDRDQHSLAKLTLVDLDTVLFASCRLATGSASLCNLYIQSSVTGGSMW